MQTYVVTGFNNNFFRYGISWIASLKELAKYNGNILVVGFNLSSLNKDRILATGAQLIEETALVDFKKITFHHLSEIANKENAVFAYWDPFVYFQKDISEILRLAESNFVACAPGFLAGPSKYWKYISDLNRIASFLGVNAEYDQILSEHFGGFVKKIDSLWNYSEPAKLKDNSGLLSFRGEPANAIYIYDEIEKFVIAKNILFWERHREIFQKYIKHNNRNNLKLLVGQQTISAVNKNS